MALQLSISTTNNTYGVAAQEAYVRITEFNGSKHGYTCTLATYVDEAARLAGKAPISLKSYNFPYVENAGDALVYLYTQLKTLPEFAGAVDV